MSDFLEPLRMKLATMRILVVGDVMLDVTQAGTVERISPEGPAPVLLSTNGRTLRAGAAANVACNVAALGARASLVGVVGQDSARDELEALLAAAGVDAKLAMDPDRPTTVKTRFVADGFHQILRVDREVERPLADAEANDVLGWAAMAQPKCNAVVLSDYAKGVLTGGDIANQIIDGATGWAVPVVVDPKGTDWSRYDGCGALLPNIAELSAYAGRRLGNYDGWRDVAEDAIARHQTWGVLLTCGPLGMVLYERSDGGFTIKEARVPALAHEVYDVTGAGDTVAAVFAMGLAAGYARADAARIANAAASVVVGKPGTATLNFAELTDAVNEAMIRFPWTPQPIRET